MTPRERVWATLRGEPTDRPAVSFWGHFYDRESSARDLVDATLEWQRRHGWDWVKLNPRKHYHVEGWGVRYRYSGSAVQKPVLESWPIREPRDWSAIGRLSPDHGALGEQLEAVRGVRHGLPTDVPLVQTVFTPLAVLGELVPEPEVLSLHLRESPAAVRAALEAVTATFVPYVRRVLEAGADGIYLATTHWASRDRMSAGEYREWARPYDLQVLAAAHQARFNVLHVCKARNLLFELADYPVAAFSFDAADPSNPTLAHALSRVPGAVMGGVSHEDALQRPDPEVVRAELREGLAQTAGRRWLVGPGCSIPPATPAANLVAVRTALEPGALRAAARPPSAVTPP